CLANCPERFVKVRDSLRKFPPPTDSAFPRPIRKSRADGGRLLVRSCWSCSGSDRVTKLVRFSVCENQALPLLLVQFRKCHAVSMTVSFGLVRLGKAPQ